MKETQRGFLFRSWHTIRWLLEDSQTTNNDKLQTTTNKDKRHTTTNDKQQTMTNEKQRTIMTNDKQQLTTNANDHPHGPVGVGDVHFS